MANTLYLGSNGQSVKVKKLYMGVNGQSVLLYGGSKGTNIYGAEWAGGSDSKWVRTDDAAGFDDPTPAVNNGTGYSPFDSIYPWAGMQKVAYSAAGTVVEIPKYYYKWTRSGTKMKLQISPVPQTGFLVSPAHADRGDGQGERDFAYVGRYHCATSTCKSETGVMPYNYTTRANFRTIIHNLGTYIWQYDFAMYWTIIMLYLVEYADWNAQNMIGYGCSNSNNIDNSGSTDAMQYHTGTNAINKTTYGHIQYRNIEDWWGNVYDFCDGIYFSGASVYCIKNPADFSDTTGGTLVGTRATLNGYIKSWTNPSDVTGFEYALYPNSMGGNESTYVCGRYVYNSDGVVLFVGSHKSQWTSQGPFTIQGDHIASYTERTIGSRLMVLPTGRL